MTDDAALREWADFQLEWLWGHLRNAHSEAAAGPFQAWTIGCESIGERIKTLSAIIGPLSWRRVAISGIADGWFAEVNEILEIPDPDLPDEAGVAYAQMWVDRQIDSVR
jgi:hypothetical protein